MRPIHLLAAFAAVFAFGGTVLAAGHYSALWINMTAMGWTGVVYMVGWIVGATCVRMDLRKSTT